MKKRLTNSTEIVIDTSHPTHWVGPKVKLKLIKSFLSEMDFHPVKVGKSLPWREVAKKELSSGEAGVLLRGARLKMGFTQEELSKKLNIAQYNLSKMESGSRPISKKMSEKLAKVLKTDYRIFL